MPRKKKNNSPAKLKKVNDELVKVTLNFNNGRMTSIKVPQSLLDMKKSNPNLSGMSNSAFFIQAGLEFAIKYGDDATRANAEEEMRSIIIRRLMSTTRNGWFGVYYALNQVEQNIIPLSLKLFFNGTKSFNKEYYDMLWKCVDDYFELMGKDWINKNKSIVDMAYTYRDFDTFMDLAKYLDVLRQNEKNVFHYVYSNIQMYMYTYNPRDRQNVIDVSVVREAIKNMGTKGGIRKINYDDANKKDEAKEGGK